MEPLHLSRLDRPQIQELLRHQLVHFARSFSENRNSRDHTSIADLTMTLGHRLGTCSTAQATSAQFHSISLISQTARFIVESGVEGVKPYGPYACVLLRASYEDVEAPSILQLSFPVSSTLLTISCKLCKERLCVGADSLLSAHPARRSVMLHEDSSSPLSTVRTNLQTAQPPCTCLCEAFTVHSSNCFVPSWWESDGSDEPAISCQAVQHSIKP